MLLRGRTRTATITVSGSLLNPTLRYTGLGSRAIVGSESPWSYALSTPDTTATFNSAIQGAWQVGDLDGFGFRSFSITYFGPRLGGGLYSGTFSKNPAVIGGGPYAFDGTISITLQEWFELTDTTFRCYEAFQDGTNISVTLRFLHGTANEMSLSYTDPVPAYSSGNYQDGAGVYSKFRWGNYLARSLHHAEMSLGQQSLSVSIAYSAGSGSASPYPYHSQSVYRYQGASGGDWGVYTMKFDADGAGGITTELQKAAFSGMANAPARPYYARFGMVDFDNGGYNASGKVFADADGYPDSLTLYSQQTDYQGNFNTGAVTANPTFTDSSVRDGHMYTAMWYVEPDAGGAAVRTYQASGFQYPVTRIGYAVSRNSLGANGEEPIEQRTNSDYRLNLYWKKWNALLPTQIATWSVDDGAATTNWSASAGCSLSVASGAVRLDVPGATAGPRLQKSYALNSEFNMHTYRYMEVRYRIIGHDNHPMRLTLGERTNPSNQGGNYRKWNLTGDTTGTWKTVTIDLCGPTEWGSADSTGATLTPVAIPAKDETWSRHPLINTSGPIFGQGLTPWIRFDMDTYSGALALEVDYIKLTRSQTPKMGVFHPGYGEQVKVKPASSSTFACYWPLRVTTDGKSSVDMAFDDGSITVYTIGQVASRWIGSPHGLGSDNPGWAVGFGSDPGDGFHNTSRRANWLGGGGVLYDSGTGAWSAYVDDQSGIIPAQSFWLDMDFYPGCGDVLGFTGNAYGGPIEVRAGIAFRGAIEGIILDVDGAPNVGIPVTTLDTVVNKSAGSATSDSIGYYKTGLPYGRGHRIFGRTQTTPTSTGTLPTSSVTWANWGRQRCSFRVPKVESLAFVQPWNLEHESGQYHSTAVHVGSGVVYWRSDFAVPLPWALGYNLKVVTSDTTDANPRMTIDYRGRITIVWERGSGPVDVWSAYSDDDGATWGGAAVAITGGTHPTIASAPDGTVILAAYVTGTIQVRRQFAGDTSFSAATVIKDDAGHDIAAQDEQFHLQPAYEGAARWLLHMRVNGETATSHWASGDDGLTWTRVL